VEVQAEQFAKKHHISVEEAGRYLRYQTFEEEAERWEKEEDTQKPVKIAVAHNKEDNAETIIMQLSRGSGLKGVAGMKPVRGRIIRPMLGVTREEIESISDRKEEINWCTDSTNLHDDYTRNRIRHDILPKLVSDVNHGAVDNITRAGRLIGEADVYLAKQAEKPS
jgi:tRNA(Ile)-lysidine synthase